MIKLASKKTLIGKLLIETDPNGNFLWTYQDIADQMATSKQYVSQIAKELGVQRYKQKAQKDDKKTSNDAIRDWTPLNANTKGHTIFNATRAEISQNKQRIIEYILAVNYGHQRYKKFGFNNNHEFLSFIIAEVMRL